jgi:cytochrome c-type biogenesis protein CcmH/NrfF
MGIPVNWDYALTLGQTVYKMVKEGKTKTPEFEKLLEHYGREKLMKLYLEEKDKRELE